jgi:cytoskeleton protein RodZ
VASFGERLKREREKRRISLDDVSLSTKIGTRLLQALEEEKFDQLPGGIFNKGFVRAYARHLGLDENQAVADYLQAAGEAPPPDPLVHAPQPARLGDRTAQPVKKIEAAAESPPLPIFHNALSKDEDRGVSIPWGILAALLFAVALAFSLWSYYTRELQPVKPYASTSRRPPAAANAGSPASEPSLSGQPQPQTSAPAGKPVTAPSDLSSRGAVPPAPLVLLIRANTDSWLSVTADGNKAFDDTLAAPGEKSIPARNQIVIKAGNVGGLEFTFNGKKLPRQGEDGEVKTLTFGPDGLQPAPPKPPS